LAEALFGIVFCSVWPDGERIDDDLPVSTEVLAYLLLAFFFCVLEIVADYTKLAAKS